MPLFEYRCDKCGKRFSMLVGVTAEKAKLRCPKCGSGKATKLISRIARTGKSEEEDFGDDFGDSGGGLEEMDEDYGDEGDGDLDDEE